MKALSVIKSAMKELGLNYSYMEEPMDDDETSEPVYPYFVGEYMEAESISEDGVQEATFILNGYARESWSELEKSKDKIKSYFPQIGKTVIVDGSTVAVFYSHSIPVRTVDAEIKKIQINLDIKEWSV